MHQGKAILKTMIACILMYLVIKLSIYFFSPFLFSILICLTIDPVTKKLIDNLHINRSLSIIIALFFFCIISIMAAYFAINNIYTETISILKNVPKYYDIFNNIILKYQFFLKSNFNIIIDGQNINDLNTEKIIYNLMNLFVSLKDSIIITLYSLPDIIVYVSFSIIAAFFILRDKETIIGLIKKISPVYIINIIICLNKSVINILKTECLLVCIGTMQAVLGFIMLRANYAILLGIIIGILDILPLIGPGIVFIPWIIYNFFIGKIIFAVSLLCLFILIIITRQVLETRLISGKLELHPLIILISIYIGLKFYGIIGTLLGPLMASALKMFYKENIC